MSRRFEGKKSKALLGAGLGLVVAGGAGAIIGAAAGIDKTYHFEGRSDLVIKAYLNELRKKARVTAFQ